MVAVRSQISGAVMAMGVAVGVVACSTPRPHNSQGSASTGRTGRAREKAAPDESQSTSKRSPATPPELVLQVLTERLDVGVAIQNRSTKTQRFAARMALQPAGGAGASRTLSLHAKQACLTLRPGAEWLWPKDWDLSLAPEQGALAGLKGAYRFRVVACGDDSAGVNSAPFELPASYFGAAGGS